VILQLTALGNDGYVEQELAVIFEDRAVLILPEERLQFQDHRVFDIELEDPLDLRDRLSIGSEHLFHVGTHLERQPGKARYRILEVGGGPHIPNLIVKPALIKSNRVHLDHQLFLFGGSVCEPPLEYRGNRVGDWMIEGFLLANCLFLSYLPLIFYVWA